MWLWHVAELRFSAVNAWPDRQQNTSRGLVWYDSPVLKPQALLTSPYLQGRPDCWHLGSLGRKLTALRKRLARNQQLHVAYRSTDTAMFGSTFISHNKLVTTMTGRLSEIMDARACHSGSSSRSVRSSIRVPGYLMMLLLQLTPQSECSLLPTGNWSSHSPKVSPATAQEFRHAGPRNPVHAHRKAG